MRYNKTLDCVDALAFHGGVTTVFARIAGDSLKDFAMVNIDADGRTVYEVDKQGRKKLIRRDPGSRDNGPYIRYCNYKPLTECGE